MIVFPWHGEFCDVSIHVTDIRARFRAAESSPSMAAEYRRIAAEYAQAAERNADPARREKNLQLSLAYLALAKEEDWFAGKINPTA